MKKIVLAALGVLGLLFVVRHRHAKHRVKAEMFEWWSADV